MAIRILVTGGTFDKEYNELTGELYFQDTHVPDMLRLGRSHRVEWTFETLMMIDSLQMDRRRPQPYPRPLPRRCRITDRHYPRHRHDGANRRAVLGRRRYRKDNCPYRCDGVLFLGSSDGMFNLGTALAFVQEPYRPESTSR